MNDIKASHVISGIGGMLIAAGIFLGGMTAQKIVDCRIYYFKMIEQNPNACRVLAIRDELPRTAWYCGSRSPEVKELIEEEENLLKINNTRSDLQSLYDNALNLVTDIFLPIGALSFGATFLGSAYTNLRDIRERDLRK